MIVDVDDLREQLKHIDGSVKVAVEIRDADGRALRSQINLVAVLTPSVTFVLSGLESDIGPVDTVVT